MVEQADQRANLSKESSNTRLPVYGIVGIAAIVLAEVLLFSKVSFVQTYFTPIVWTGYIVLIDAVNFKVHGNSLLRTRTRELVLMLPWSVLCWLVFEAYNLYLQNWTYVGLPSNIVYRWIGFVWSFATIFPAILETAELVRPWYRTVRTRPLTPSNRVLFALLVAGTACLILPLLVNQPTASQLFALVWVGFVLVFEPINYWMRGRSIIHELRDGNLATLLCLFTSGMVCGVLWEFWNYWSGAKWFYSVPLSVAGPKIFEMPLFGYLGFPAFATEVYALQNFMATVIFRKQLVPSSS